MKNKPAVQFTSSSPKGYSTVNWSALNAQTKDTSKWNPHREKTKKAETIWPSQYIMRIEGSEDKIFPYEIIAPMLGSNTPYFDEYYEDPATKMIIWPLEGFDKHISQQ